MRRLFVPTLTLFALVAAVWMHRAWAQTPPAPSAPAPPAPGNAARADSLAASRDSLMNEVLRAIAGRESAPAESVFKDIRVLKGMAAGRVVRIMNMGFGRSLGVGCDHCHTVGEWAKEDKPAKQVTRDMWGLVGAINRELLPKIPNLESKQPSVNCATCHRGDRKPATSLPGR